MKSPGIAGEIKKGPSDLRMAEVRVAAPAGDQHFITSHSVRFKTPTILTTCRRYNGLCMSMYIRGIFQKTVVLDADKTLTAFEDTGG